MSAPSSDAAPVPYDLQDFPDWMPAMLVKELRQGLRATLFVMPFMVVQFLAALAVVMEATGGAGLRVGESPFWLVTVAVVAFVMPFRGFAALREEAAEGNSSLLMLGGLSRWQIVLGKWLVQFVLSALTLLSLVPHMLVRYFIGGVEIIPNLLMAIVVLITSGGVSACIIGASGYAPVPLRFIVAAIGSFWVISSGVVIAGGLSFIMSMDTRSLIAGACAVGMQVLYAITGLQLGRAHLKLYLLPYEIAPTRSVVSLMIFLPFIILAGSIGTLFYGAPVIIGLVIFAMIRYDRPWRPAAGNRPQQVSGFDTGFRPMH